MNLTPNPEKPMIALSIGKFVSLVPVSLTQLCLSYGVFTHCGTCACIIVWKRENQPELVDANFLAVFKAYQLTCNPVGEHSFFIVHSNSV